MKDVIGIITLFVVMTALIIIAMFIALPDAHAIEPIQLRTVAITYSSYFQGSAEPLIMSDTLVGHRLDKGLDLTINTDVFHYLFWNNTVHSLIDTAPDGSGGQFRQVGWEYSYGVDVRRIWSYIPVTVSMYHFSQHLLDAEYPWHFPVKDGVQIKVFLYDRRD